MHNVYAYYDAGARAKSDRNDWIIEACKTSPALIHAAGIDSPGLAGSPAIALAVVDLLRAAVRRKRRRVLRYFLTLKPGHFPIFHDRTG